MANLDALRIAVIGLGWVATNRHIPIILRDQRLKLTGVVDTRPDRIDRVKVSHPRLRSSVSRDGEMPWGDEVQAVLIATDPSSHYPLAKRMLQEGKHVLMEKPLTMRPAEAQDLEETARRAQIVCCVVHNFQFARSTLQLQALIKEGGLGDIRGIEAVQLSNPLRRLPVWYEQLPFGLFFDESPHMLYMLEALSGSKLERVESTVLRKSGQNTPLAVTAHYLAGGLPIRLTMNFDAPLSEWHVAVLGSKRIGVIDVFRDILVTVPNDGQHRAREILTTSSSVIRTHLVGFATSGVMLLRGSLFYGAEVVWQRFIDSIETGRTSPEISAARGWRIVEMQHQLMNESTLVDVGRNEDPGNQ